MSNYFSKNIFQIIHLALTKRIKTSLKSQLYSASLGLQKFFSIPPNMIVKKGGVGDDKADYANLFLFQPTTLIGKRAH